MTQHEIEFYRRLAHGIAAQFGPRCEVVVHDLECDADHSIVAIENGSVSGRHVGDGPSHIVLEAKKAKGGQLEDRIGYLTRTRDGRILRSSTIYLRNQRGRVIGILAINYDISMLLALEDTISPLIANAEDKNHEEPEHITQNVADLLDDLINESIRLVGKPAALMTKEDKMKAIEFLDTSGAMMITKAGPRICEVFSISKYTLYNYLDDLRTRRAEGGKKADKTQDPA
jgi:predicted transcriptional regulator YheO